MDHQYKTVHDLWLGLDAARRTQFALTCRTSEGYVSNALVHARKWPKIQTVERMARACNEAGFKTTPEELLVWFYHRRTAAMAAARRRTPHVRRRGASRG